MRYRAKTASGSLYDIDWVTRTWSKNGGPTAPIKELRSGDRNFTPTVFAWDEVTEPVVGESLFILSDDEELSLVLTTRIVSVGTADPLEDTLIGNPEDL